MSSFRLAELGFAAGIWDIPAISPA